MTLFPWKGVAWDIDGTLVDSEPLHHRALVLACAGEGLDISDIDPRTYLGVQIHEVLDGLLPRMPTRPERETFLGRLRRHYQASAHELQPIPGAVATLRRLAELGVPQVCVSNSERVLVDANLAVLGIAPLLQGSISVSDVSRGKPDPEPYLRGAALAGLDPADMLAIEDSTVGARSALAAGMQVALLGAEGETHGLGQRVHPIAGLAGVFDLRPAS